MSLFDKYLGDQTTEAQTELPVQHDKIKTKESIFFTKKLIQFLSLGFYLNNIIVLFHCRLAFNNSFKFLMLKKFKK